MMAVLKAFKSFKGGRWDLSALFDILICRIRGHAGMFPKWKEIMFLLMHCMSL